MTDSNRNARDRIAQALEPYCGRTTDDEPAQAVLAILPELLTDDDVVEAAYLASLDITRAIVEDPTGEASGTWLRWKAGLRGAAQALTAERG